MVAKELLKEKLPQIYWPSCVAHTINLMLDGIGNLSNVKGVAKKAPKGVAKKAKELTIFIYSHHMTLATMRRYTKEIVWLGTTRFATTFPTLSSLVVKKGKLRLMFSLYEWYKKCKFRKTWQGRKAKATVMQESSYA